MPTAYDYEYDRLRKLRVELSRITREIVTQEKRVEAVKLVRLHAVKKVEAA